MENISYIKTTHEEMMEDFESRIANNDQVKNTSKASEFSLLEEILAGGFDFCNYMIQRTAEEAYLSTCKLTSSGIKHAKQLTYVPKRKIPSQASISITLTGPLPSSLIARCKN